MRFPTDVPVKLVMLGTGGTGGHAAPHLYRLLHALNRPARFILCDGDLVEAKNLIRQNFAPADLGQNKARVLAERYASVFGMKAEYVPSFVETREELMRLIRPGIWEIKEGPYLYKLKREMVLLLGCVDNNKSRRLCHEAFCQSQDLVYIDSGNEEFSGQVVCGVRRNGRTIFKPVGGIAPEILKAQDRFPSEISCAEAAQADPQSMAANIMAATVMVDMVYNIALNYEDQAARQNREQIENISTDLERLERVQYRLGYCVSQLPKPLSTIIQELYIRGKERKDIILELGLSESTFRRYRQKAIEDLAEMYLALQSAGVVLEWDD